MDGWTDIFYFSNAESALFIKGQKTKVGGKNFGLDKSGGFFPRQDKSGGFFPAVDKSGGFWVPRGQKWGVLGTEWTEVGG